MSINLGDTCSIYPVRRVLVGCHKDCRVYSELVLRVYKPLFNVARGELRHNIELKIMDKNYEK